MDLLDEAHWCMDHGPSLSEYPASVVVPGLEYTMCGAERASGLQRKTKVEDLMFEESDEAKHLWSKLTNLFNL
ncbi:hypothetical protein E2C01_025923 [Portunus trituberculatus]|uniref:Uncharacterized protein n=1 Tax=Portunus trituberculatus TaxID=210409 RepID=A0A5B7EJ98_PORTR|nr:hypothetical protein [Portunus trituberculatus]